MHAISIATEVCKRCGTCTMTCARAIFRQEDEGTVPRIVDRERCIGCGHCVAACPQGAISHSAYPEGTVYPIRAEYVPSYDHVLELIRVRRSRRLFEDKPVDRDVIEKVLEAARFAPSDHNRQSTEFIVVQDKKTIHEMGALTAAYYGRLVQQLGNPIGKAVSRLMIGRRATEAVLGSLPDMARRVSLFEAGKDYILREAPVLILFCADSVGGFPSVNANLAVMNASLAAEALGLACFYAGFLVGACDRDASIARLVSLPETHKIYGALGLGYPRVTFSKWPERNPAKITWAGAD